MFIRKYWIPLSVFLVAIAGVGLYLLATQPPKDPIVIYKPVEPIEKPTQQPKAEVPEGDTSQGGHIHADGTWHEGPHEPVEQPTESAQQSAVPDISGLPETSDDIDPDDIPPFSVPYSDGMTYHYDRPLTPEERTRYSFLKALPDYEGVSPAKLKMEAIAYVRHEQIREGAFEQISLDLTKELVSGRITEEEFRKRKAEFVDDFFERTR